MTFSAAGGEEMERESEIFHSPLLGERIPPEERERRYKEAYEFCKRQEKAIYCKYILFDALPKVCATFITLATAILVGAACFKLLGYLF